MQFPTPLIRGTLIKRYKRFLADVTLDDGSEITAHVANPGAMLGLKDPGIRVWLSKSDNPKRKLKYSWELAEIDGHMVGINTAHPNGIVEEAILSGAIPELSGYDALRREVKYGENSRIDILLSSENKPDCYVEVKNVHLKRGPEAEFPDSVTARGTKHLRELAEMVRQGHRAVMVYIVQREDCNAFKIAADIDPTYASTLDDVRKQGVETLCYACALSTEQITVANPLKLAI